MIAPLLIIGTGVAVFAVSGDWAGPINTFLLIILAIVQQRHYAKTSAVERKANLVENIVNQRKADVPPPDGEYKRECDAE